jgi:LacI family transcriptional regulator, galactose operon repressor
MAPRSRTRAGLAASSGSESVRKISAAKESRTDTHDIAPRVTLSDIAGDAGVSRATVSLVLRNVPVVAEETREKVLSSMRRLRYVYHRAAASLRTQRTHAIGLIVTDITNPFFAEIIVAIEDKLGNAGYVTLLGNTSETVSKQERLIATMQEYPADGLLLCPATDRSATFAKRIQNCRIPRVLFVRSLPGVDCDYVGVDNVFGAQSAVEHLVILGHRRIAFIGGASEVSSRKERVTGYENALRKSRCRVDPSRMLTSAPNREGGYQAMQQLLQLPEMPTAALCFNDLVAIGAMQALSAAGKTPGQDFALVGFNDVAEAALCRPALTTIATTPGKIGEVAAELLLDRIAHRSQPNRKLILRPRLIVRESCGRSLSANHQ